MKWTRTVSGVYIPGWGCLAGMGAWRVNHGPWKRQRNVLTNEGIDFLVNTYGVPPGSLAALDLYFAPFGNDVVPTTAWTAASFDGIAGEIGDPPEGYVESNRQEWSFALTGSATYTNDGAPGVINVRTATQLQICGFGILTNSTKSNTGGVLLAALRFADAPVLFDDHDIVDLSYRIESVVP